MGKFMDLTGMKFGRLTVREQAGRDKNGNVLWRCECECGKESVVAGIRLRNGHTKSCGCLNYDSAKERFKTHGEARSKLYNVWRSMKCRCSNPNDKAYKNYGGRGIRVCEEWQHDYAAFREWAMDAGYREGVSIDRINNDMGYSPENCRWTTRKEQQRNRRGNHYLTLNGETKTIIEWAEVTGVPFCTISSRLKYGWTVEEALTTPPGKKK